MGGASRPSRVRVLDLPFTAVEWVLPVEAAATEPMPPAEWAVWQRSPKAGEHSLSGYSWDGSDSAAGRSCSHP